MKPEDPPVKPSSLEPPSEHLGALINLLKNKKFEEALVKSKALLADFPHSSNVQNLFGAVNSALGRYDIAIETYRKALGRYPKNALIYNNMANAFSRKGDIDSAVKCFEKALKIEPKNDGIFNKLGQLMTGQKKYEDASGYFRKSLEINPGNAHTYFCIGNLMANKGEFDTAIQYLEKSLGLNPNQAGAYNNLGVCMRGKGAIKDAIANYDKALALEPKNVGSHYNKALLVLNLQDFENGWPMYEYRWKKSKLDSTPLVTRRPEWRFGDQNRVLVWGEQGLGDEVMFASLIPDIYAACSKLIVKADKRLIPIFKRSFPIDIEYYPNEETVPEETYDTHIPMGSLPKYFRQNLHSFEPASQGFLSADKARTAAVRDKLLEDGSKTIIGLSWHSTSKIRVAPKRTIRLGQLASAFQAEKVKFVSLQYGNVDADIDQVKKEYGIDVVQVAEIDNFHDIDGLAALMSACDRIISIDNVTVHLAGALGRGIDVLLPRVSNWRWGLDPNSSYWYRSVRLHRQSEREEWGEVLERFS